MALTDDAHNLVRTHFENKVKRIAVDATCGNGFDTEFLVELGFLEVHAFDIQNAALSNTKNRLSDKTAKSVELHLASHDRITEFVNDKIDCIMFNFGYLPGGDKNITTNANTSVKALEKASKLLHSGGLISLICYPGHPSGALETKAIKTWFKNLNSFSIETHLAASPKPSAPILYQLTKT